MNNTLDIFSVFFKNRTIMFGPVYIVAVLVYKLSH